MAQGTMQAVVFGGPFKVSVEERPIPKVLLPTDAIVKVHAAGLCGSELHVYRGIEKSTPGFIMGHEFTGEVVEVGSDVQGLKQGDRVVSPFTISCGTCWFCQRQLSSRCVSSLLFGSPALDGAQASHVRVPLASATLLVAPPTTRISDEALLLMADIWPTGFFGARNALRLVSDVHPDPASCMAAVIGCGPVGLCAVLALRKLGASKVIAVDGVADRLARAKGLGARGADLDSVRKVVEDETEGRGVDVVVEAVGLSPAMRTAFDIIRPGGAISSVGVHNGEIPWTGNEAYKKNIKLQMGRCPVRSVFEDSLHVLEGCQDELGFMFEHNMSIASAVEAFELFDKNKVQKVVFRP